ncbi:MAG: HAMP domain-containing sensor histidine kinase [Pseudomonadota bacterium]
MATRRSIIWYWILLGVPTVLIAGAAFTLLSHEQDRISRSLILSLADRAEVISGTVTITVEEVQEAMIRSLAELSPDTVEKTLQEWAAVNPLVRNAFVWNPGTGLAWPGTTLEFTAEERRFVQRYEALFSGRMDWKTGRDVSREELGGQGAPQKVQGMESGALQPGLDGDVGSRQPYREGRRKLLDLAASPDQAQGIYPGQTAVHSNAGPVRTAADSGWIPWFAENRLFILGWVRTREKGPVYGVELELMTLLSRLIPDLPRMTGPGTAYALVDGNGDILFQSGTFPVDEHLKPDVRIPVSTRLPHWQIQAYVDHAAPGAGKGFLYVSGLLLAIFVAAILLGGGLLTRQANRDRMDALRKTSFVSSVSHELKTPLTSIRMCAELLQSGRVAAPDKMHHYLSVIVSESQRLTRLVNNVLDFGRLEQGKKRYNRELFDLRLFLEALVDTHAIRIRGAGMEPSVHLPPAAAPVEMDRDALEQVILNLVDNAVKYAAQGKILDFILEDTPGNYFSLRIQDRGPGIPPGHREAIFDMFHRVDDSLTSSQPGSGLGLSIARRMLRDLDGDLVFEPMDGGGSCFKARIRKHE